MESEGGGSVGIGVFVYNASGCMVDASGFICGTCMHKHPQSIPVKYSAYIPN